MVIYLSQSNLAAEFVCFLYDCTGRIDFSFEGKQRRVLKKCEQHRWETEGAGFLFAVPWEECYGCLHALEHEPEQKRGNRQSGLLTISASRLLKIALVVLSLGSSCRNETKCNKNLVECACSVEACLETVGMVHLKVIIHSYQVIMIFTHYQGCFGDWGITSNLSHCHSPILFVFNCILLLHWFPLTPFCYNSWYFKFFHFWSGQNSVLWGFFKLESLWMCYLTSYMFL